MKKRRVLDISPFSFWNTPSSFLSLSILFPYWITLAPVLTWMTPLFSGLNPNTPSSEKSSLTIQSKAHPPVTFSDNTCFYLYKVWLFVCCISQTSPEKQKHQEIYIDSPTYLSIFIVRSIAIYLYLYYLYRYRFTTGIGSNDHGSWEVLCSTVCKLENQKWWWCNSVQRPENWGGWRGCRGKV